MFELKVENHRGEVLNLSTSPMYTVFNITGLQPPAVTVNSSVNSTSDGSIINSTRVEKRNIVIYIAINGDVEASRNNLYKYFPLKQTVTLYFKNGVKDVLIKGVIELIECDLFSNRQTAQISIICPQPYFKGVEDIVSHFNEVSAYFQFPFAIGEDGMEYSAITTNVRKSIINTGDVASGLIIDMYAMDEVINPVIYNAFNRTFMRLNFTMQRGDRIVINTNTGAKSITLTRAGVSRSIMGHMSPNSTWLTLEAGDNVFTYGADNSSSNLQLVFNASVLYGGV